MATEIMEPFVDYVLIIIGAYSLATAEFYTLTACEDAGKAYVAAAPGGAYVCKPKAHPRPRNH